MKLQPQKLVRIKSSIAIRGMGTEEAIALIVNGYCKDVLNQLPMEFAVEAQKLPKSASKVQWAKKYKNVRYKNLNKY